MIIHEFSDVIMLIRTSCFHNQTEGEVFVVSCYDRVDWKQKEEEY
jgi:hypothetical protein